MLPTNPLLRKYKTTNLISLSIRFGEKLEKINQLGVDFCQIFSSLSELRCLSLKLYKSSFIDSSRSLKCPWLKDASKIISDNKKLKQFTFEWDDFCFESSRSTFHALCQCIRDLPQLSFLDLRFPSARSVQDKDILTLANSKRNLKR